MEEEMVEKVKELLWQETSTNDELNVYAVLDVARDENLFIGLMNSDEEYVCLYKGEKAKELATVAPYLVKLDQESPFTKWIIGDGWGESWGIYCHCELPMNKVRDHFRKFLMVVDEEDKTLYFRYYDPRVLRVYLPTCNKEELDTVFGPINLYYVEGEKGKSLVNFSLQTNELDASIIDLTLI